MSEISQGQVEAVLIKAKGEAASKSQASVTVEWDGFVGDKHFGPTKKAGSSQKPYPKGTIVRNTRQVSIVSVEELGEIAGDLEIPGIEAEWLSANLLFSGIKDLTQIPPGSRLHFENGVGLVVEGANPPCTSAGGLIQENYPDKGGITSAFPKKAIGKRGLVAWVERPGSISKGEKVVVQGP